MGSILTINDVSPAFRAYLAADAGLLNLLGYKNGEHDEVAIHKESVPQQSMWDKWCVNREQSKNQTWMPCEDDTRHARPYMWYELEDEITSECVTGCNDSTKPIEVSFAVEIVSFDLEEADAIKLALREAIADLCWDCTTGLKCMGGMHIQQAKVVNSSDEYQYANILAASFGGFVRSLSVELRPYWESI